ncbi:unnamed protein product [Macrosiphum euphorbiae]|uniref:Uncharacterized protein n=1 Tax=Macrosiphum euphorbiae TaxID=13131 RepID=A0AAV0WF53_9HEMI|nr:unnamed protein product [Macrosiphum euphorbiae]
MGLLVGTDSSIYTRKIRHKHIITLSFLLQASTNLQRRLKTRRNLKRFNQRTTTGTIPCGTLSEHRHKLIVRSNDDADSGPRRSSAPTSERRQVRSRVQLSQSIATNRSYGPAAIP